MNQMMTEATRISPPILRRYCAHFSPHVHERGLERRQAVGRQLHDERRLVHLEKRAPHQTRRRGQQDAQRIEPEHHEAGMGGKEDAGEQQVHRKPGAARHERRDHHGDEPAAAALDRTRGHDRRHVASEAHDQRNERLAVQSDPVHHAVHDECSAGQVARILHERNEQIEDHDVGQKDDHAAHAADHAVRHQVLERAVGHPALEAGADASHDRVDPLLGIGAQLERAVEHQPHEEEEDRKAPQLVGDERVDERRGRRLLPLPGV